VQWVQGRGDLYDRGAHALQAILDQGQPATRERVVKAVDDLLEHLQHSPDSWSALYLAGRGQSVLDEPQAACVLLKRAYALEPDRPEVARELALALLRADMPEQALEPAAAACRAWPEDSSLLTNLALASLLSGDPQAAMSHAEQAMRLNPKDPNNRALLLLLEDIRMGRCDPPKTLEEAQAASSAAR
jgi:Flp pilus assembly protein TadD